MPRARLSLRHTRPLPQQPSPCQGGLVLLELALRAPRTVERDLRRLVVGEVGGPALLVGRQPRYLALGALRDQNDAFGPHGSSLRRVAKRHGMLSGRDDLREVRRRAPARTTRLSRHEPRQWHSEAGPRFRATGLTPHPWRAQAGNDRACDVARTHEEIQGLPPGAVREAHEDIYALLSDVPLADEEFLMPRVVRAGRRKRPSA
jgi:hypothetical protein